MLRKLIYLLLPLLLLIGRPLVAQADFIFIIPQEPGGGTSIWAQVVADELAKKLGEPIVLRHLPGARDRIGFEKFHRELRFDDHTVMVSHGGNAVSFLQEKVDYDYAAYESVALMNNNIIVSRLTDLDWRHDKLVFPERSGTVPESLALALLVGGPAAPANWTERVVYVKGMSTPECRLAFRRKEINITRENPAAHLKHVAPIAYAAIFFNHGLFNAKTGRFDPDPNFLETPTLEQLYQQEWGQAPSGPLYDAYRMVKAWRDGVQKALWVNRGNPNRDRLRRGVAEMLADPASLSRIRERLGQYPWQVGEEAQQFIDSLYPLITEPALRTLVDFNRNILRLDSYFNAARVWKKP
jgi:hypothetical protein